MHWSFSFRSARSSPPSTATSWSRRPAAALHEFLPNPGPDPATGLLHGGPDTDPYARGAASFYIPGNRGRSEPLPLVIALHGGFGHGRDFIWTWLREARSRRFALACPTSLNITWTITGPDADGEMLKQLLAFSLGRWNIDRSRILLTGLSDGATYALKRSLDEETPFYALCHLLGPPGAL